MKAKLLILLLITILTIVLIAGCNDTGQKVQAIAVPIETTIGATHFSASNLTIKPIDPSGLCDIYNLTTDDEIVVSITLTNNGSRQGTHNVILNIDWVEVETKSVTLAAGQSTNVEFNLMWGTNEDGVYDVAIEGLHGIFGVG
ncbi:hypothetical protein ACFLYB_06845 [Chloroflexota bacterium]